MEIIQANQAKSDNITKLIQLNPQLDQALLEDCGYVVDIEGEPAGCFVLQPVESASYWLRQLYLQPESAGKVIVLLETILQLAKQQSASALFVNSHDESVDIMLEALQFQQTTADSNQSSEAELSGKWWIYQVS